MRRGTPTTERAAESAEMRYPHLTLYVAGSGGELYFESDERYFVYKNGELTEEIDIRYDFV